MGKANFILKDSKSKEETLVYLILNYDYKRFKYSTGEKIEPKFWNPKNQRAKETKKFREYPEFNSRLDKIANDINTVYRRFLNDGIKPDNALLKDALNAEVRGSVFKPIQITLFEFIDSFIEERKLQRANATIKLYNTVFNYLKAYSDKINKEIDFEDIDLDFYNKYLVFLTKTNKLAVNTVGKHIKVLKGFLNEATDRGINNNLDYKKSKFKSPSEESDTVYLSLKELKKIEKANLSEAPRLEKVRDLFLIGCYTGLRFSDYSQIKPENINLEKSVLQVRTRKTGQRVSIPLHPVVKNILKKYNNDLPKAYVNQVMNRYIKELARKAEINTEVETTITKGGKVERTIQPKSELISTHTARRSFATNLFLQDVPAISIMKLTGHKSEKSFLKYIRVTQEQNADKLLNHPFFN